MAAAMAGKEGDALALEIAKHDFNRKDRRTAS